MPTASADRRTSSPWETAGRCEASALLGPLHDSLARGSANTTSAVDLLTRPAIDAEVRSALAVLLTVGYRYRVDDVARILRMTEHSVHAAFASLLPSTRHGLHRLLDIHRPGSSTSTTTTVAAAATPPPQPRTTQTLTTATPHRRRHRATSPPREAADDPRGICPVCLREFCLRADGMVWHHKRRDPFQRRCDGAGEPPLPPPPPRPLLIMITSGDAEPVVPLADIPDAGEADVGSTP